MPASKVLETSLVCTRSAQFALSSGVNDDFTCDKVEKKSTTCYFSLVAKFYFSDAIPMCNNGVAGWFVGTCRNTIHPIRVGQALV
jgi:hypothetical protein